jgi:predicted RND superfamily exporter protein
MNRFDQTVERAAEGLINWRRPFLILFTLVTLFFGYSASKVQLDPGFMKLLPVKHEYMQTMLEYMSDFSGANTLLVNLEWKGEGDIYNPEFMTALREATDEVFFIPGINRTRVSSLFTPDVYYIEITESGFRGEPVVPARFSGTPEQMAQVRSNVELSGQVGQLVANNLRGAMIRADLHEYDPDSEVKVDYWEVQQHLHDIRERFESENIEVHIIGFARLLGDVIEGLLWVFAFFALAFLITVLLLYWYTRSWRITATALVVAMLPVLWLVGTLPLIGYGIDPMSILVPFLIFAIGVSHAVQMTSAWRLEVVEGKSSQEAAKNAFTKLFVPGAVALLTEALGFGVIMFINIPIVHELGITACLGVLLMIITNKMILPIILSYLTLEKSSQQTTDGQEQAWIAPLVRKIATCAEPRCALVVFGICLGLLSVTTWISRDLVVGDQGEGVPELHEDSRYNMDSRAISQSYDIGVDVLTVIVEAKDFDGDSCLHYPVINLVDRFELYMRGVDGVQSVTSVAGIGKLVISAFNEGNPRWRALPRTETGLSTGSNAFDPKLGLNNEGCRAIQVLTFMKNHDGTLVAHAVREIKAFIEENPVEGVTLRLASGNVGVMAATNEAVGAAEVRMLGALFGALTLFCLITFRSIRATLCVLVPLAMVCVFANAVMAGLGIGLKVATLPVIALGVGVGIDYALYLFERIQHHMEGEDMTFRDAFELAMLERGKAAVFTAITMSVGVATWMFSALKFQADMGLLLAFMFLVNMLAAICLLPALGAWFYHGEGRPRPAVR